MIDRPALLVADLERIPAVLRAHATAPPLTLAAALGHRRPERLVLTGLGSSRFAALAVESAFRAGGLEVIVEHASTSRPAPVDERTLVVGISSSGATQETVAAVARARAAGASTLAITNQPGSALAAAAGGVLTLDAADEASGVASLTFAATIAALTRLAAALGADIDALGLLEAAARAADEAIADRPGWLPAAADLLGTGVAIHVIGDAAALGDAEQAALLFRECPRLESDAMDAGDWLHVGIYTALPGYRALLLAGSPYDAEIVGTIHDRGGRVVAIGPAPVGPTPERAERADLTIQLPPSAAGDPVVRSLVEPIVAASIAAELWHRASAETTPG
ncbi:MAG: hypothetical protein HW391_2050 [Chloroflexi bacterium]|nr:hypothetical protein [Chloroflexota bacterium]